MINKGLYVEQIDRKTDRSIQTERQTERRTERQADRQKDKQIDRQKTETQIVRYRLSVKTYIKRQKDKQKYRKL